MADADATGCHRRAFLLFLRRLHGSRAGAVPSLSGLSAALTPRTAAGSSLLCITQPSESAFELPRLLRRYSLQRYRVLKSLVITTTSIH